MKRILAAAIAAIMIFSLCVSVSAGMAPYGNVNPDGSIEAVPVPKVTTAPVIDGIFDDVYNERSLRIPVTRDSVEGDRQEMGDVYGFAYLIFDDANLYIYVDCYDSTVWNVLDYIAICSECGKQVGAPKTDTSEGCTHGEKLGSTILSNDDCVDIMIDFTNSGEQSQVSQYRIHRANFCSRGFDTRNLGFAGAAAEFEGRWGAEFAIPLETSDERTEIGINGMVHSQNSTEDSPSGVFDETIAYFQNSAQYGSLWDAPFYDYIILGNETFPGNFGTVGGTGTWTPATGGKCGDNLTWTLDEGGTLTIETIDKYAEFSHMYDYDGSYAPWYGSRDKITTVIIGNGVTSLGDYAFFDCTKLKDIVLPHYVYRIGEKAFYGCSSLTSVTMPDFVTIIGGYAFYGCSSLTEITLPKIKYIGRSMFEGCSSLTEITIPNSVDSIADSAFKGCSSLTSVTIPDSVTLIANGAFSGCSSLKNFTIPSSVTNIGEIAFSSCESLTSVTIPDKVTEIALGTFYGCSSLTEITIPDSVTTIGTISFTDCTSLNGITIPDSVTYIGHLAFDNTAYYNDSANWTEDVLYIGNHLIKAENSLTGDYSVCAGTKTIAEDAFKDCTSLTSVTIPDGVINIGDEAFRWCSSLTSVTIPDSVTGIGDNAFNGCNALRFIVAEPAEKPAEWKNIGVDNDKLVWNAFVENGIVYQRSDSGKVRVYKCLSDSDTVDIPKRVSEYDITEIYESAFSGCDSLTSITIPEGVTSIGDSAFSDCTSLKGVTIPVSVTGIGDKAFNNSYDVTIKGYTGSYAQAFANKNGIPFVDVRCDSNIHVYGDWVIDRAESCTEAGLKHRECEVCNKIESADIAALGHDYDTEWTIDTPATETAEGSKSRHCKRDGCDAKTDVTVICKDGTHIYGDWVIDRAESCTETGLKHRECEVCYEIENSDIAALGHDYDTEWTVDTPATETAEGSKSRHCKRDGCDAKTDVTVICKDGSHVYGDWVTDRAESCTEAGLKHRECEVCHEIESADIAALGHDYDTEWTVDVESTVGVPGSKSHHCKVCGEKTDITEIPAKVSVTKLFKDVVPDEWYVSAVQYAVDNSLFFGVSDNEFAPDEAMNRAMLVTVLWRSEGKPTVSAENTFTDVPADEWYTDAVIWAAENGVVFGTGENEFSPEDEITREDMAAILYRYAQKKGYDLTASTELNTFPDGESASEYARDALSWACGSGLIFGSDGKLLPQDGATRAQVAAILMRYMEKVVQG